MFFLLYFNKYDTEIPVNTQYATDPGEAWPSSLVSRSQRSARYNDQPQRPAIAFFSSETSFAATRSPPDHLLENGNTLGLLRRSSSFSSWPHGRCYRWPLPSY